MDHLSGMTKSVNKINKNKKTNNFVYTWRNNDVIISEYLKYYKIGRSCSFPTK